MSVERIEDLEKKIAAYDNAYHNLDLSLISDEEYDKLVSELENLLKLNPTYSSKLIPGFIENKGGVVPLTEPMLSIAKVNDLAIVKKRLDLYKDYVIEEKEDGVGVRIIYDKNGSLQFIHIRGNGFAGKDISHRKYLISGIPDVIDNDTGKVVNITGEVVCTNEEFKTFQEEADGDIGPERNVVSGFLRRDEAGEDDGELPLYFIAFHTSKLIRDKCQTYKKLREWLMLNGFELPDTFDQIPEEKPTGNFPIDGIVVKLNDLSKWEEKSFTGYNDYSFCFKYPTEVVHATVTGVSWNVNSQGYVHGVLTYLPVSIGKITASKCTFYYPEIYIKNGLRIGAKIEVTLGNEIIPKLVGLVTNGVGELISFPECCPCCKEAIVKEAEGTYRCINTLCQGQLTVRIKKALGTFGFDIKGLGSKKAETLIESENIVIPSQIFSLTESSLKEVGISKKIAKKILSQIEDAKSLPLVNWLYAAAIPKLGKTRCIEIQNFIQEYPCKNVDQLMSILGTDIMCDLFGIDGLSIISYVSNNNQDLKEFFSYMDFKDLGIDSTDYIPIAITGSCDIPRSSLISFLKDNNYWVDNRVTKSSQYILVGDNPSPGKLGLAERYDITPIYIKGLSAENILKQLEKK